MRCLRGLVGNTSDYRTSSRVVTRVRARRLRGKMMLVVLAIFHNKNVSKLSVEYVNVKFHQDGRVVKALDLSSNGRMSAWVRSPLLVNYIWSMKLIFSTFSLYLKLK